MKTLIIWFSRHSRTETQQREIERNFALPPEIFDFSDLAKIEIVPENFGYFIKEFFDRLYNLIKPDEKAIIDIYGVIPPILRSVFVILNETTPNDNIIINTLESWNIRRTPEGSAPTFEHKEFLLTGIYKIKLPISDYVLDHLINTFK